MKNSSEYKAIKEEEEGMHVGCVPCINREACLMSCIKFEEVRVKEGLKACSEGYYYIKKEN